MRNRNEAGNVHFDQETSEMPVEKVFTATIRGRDVVVPILIPLKILKHLKSTDFDQAQQVILRQYDHHLARVMLSGDLLGAREKVVDMLKVEVCEHLYNAFTIAQHHAGNQVWATPRTMQEVGPSPENDGVYKGGIN